MFQCFARTMLWLFLGLLPTFALAQNEHQSFKVSSPALGPVILTLIMESGFLGPTPARAVVVDADDNVRAATPIGYRLQIKCPDADLQNCSVTDPSASVVYHFESAAGVLLVPRSEFGAFFSDKSKTLGFKPTKLGLKQRLKSGVSDLVKSPFTSLIGSLWWTFFWSLFSAFLIKPLLALFDKNALINTAKAHLLGRFVTGLLLGTFHLFITAFVASFSKPSFDYLSLLALFGLVIFLLLRTVQTQKN